MTSPSLSVRVRTKKIEAVDICSFELVDADGGNLPAFSAGSHIDVEVASGVTRQYSLCNNPAEDERYIIAVLRDPASRGGSRAMHDQVKEGDILRISAPKNHFALAEDAQRTLLLAGGIGVTPILCMAERLSVGNADFEMHYCTRSRERTAFIDRIAAARFAPRVHLHFDDGPADQKLHLREVLAQPQAGTHLYVCGPKGFMDAVLSTARENGWPENQVHYEFFAAELIHSDEETSFEVQLASSGRIVAVTKRQTIVKALAEAGVEIPTSCEQGVCGTCLTRCLEGIPDHRDMYLTPDEQGKNDQLLPCCSRAKTARLVLDL